MPSSEELRAEARRLLASAVGMASSVEQLSRVLKAMELEQQADLLDEQASQRGEPAAPPPDDENET